MASQVERSSGTQQRILLAAQTLFSTRGWGPTSIEEVVREAGVTKGALYHHFPDKVSLLRAVYEHQEQQLVELLVSGSSGLTGPLATLRAGCRVFLEACLNPTFRRIALIEAPAALGWDEWRQIDARYGFGLLRGAVEGAVTAGELLPLPVDDLAHLLLAALMETALLIGSAADPDAAVSGLATTFDALLDGLTTAK